MSDLPTNDFGLPRWADQSETVVEPSSGQKDAGWASGERPPPGTLNWLHYLTYLWLALVDAVLRAKRVWRTECWDFVIDDRVANGWAIGSGGPIVATIEDPSATMRHRHVKITGAAVVDDVGYIQSKAFHYFTITSDVWVEWEQHVTTYGTTSAYAFECGIFFAANNVIYVRKSEASANWFLYVQDATGTTSTDTTIVATVATTYRMRLEYDGPEGDGTDARVRLYIDGVLAATVENANVPKNQTGTLMFRGYNNDAGDANGNLLVGPVAYSSEVQP